jgi:hypothetical protein
MVILLKIAICRMRGTAGLLILACDPRLQPKGFPAGAAGRATFLADGPGVTAATSAQGASAKSQGVEHHADRREGHRRRSR